MEQQRMFGEQFKRVVECVDRHDTAALQVVQQLQRLHGLAERARALESLDQADTTLSSMREFPGLAQRLRLCHVRNLEAQHSRINESWKQATEALQDVRKLAEDVMADFAKLSKQKTVNDLEARGKAFSSVAEYVMGTQDVVRHVQTAVQANQRLLDQVASCQRSTSSVETAIDEWQSLPPECVALMRALSFDPSTVIFNISDLERL